jgi:DNA-binding phage protein
LVSALEDPDSEAVLAAVCDITQVRGMADVAAIKRKGL